MGSRIEIPWGSASLPVELPDSWKLLGTLLPPQTSSVPRPDEALRDSLAHPIGTTPLRSRDLSSSRIVLVVEDGSRPTPVHRFFGTVLRELLEAGAQRENITVLMALGVHRPMLLQEVEAKVGKEDLNGISWHNHDAKDPSGLVTLGSTSRGTTVSFNKRLTDAELILCIGGIEPHALLGFSGGMKMLLPGCAGAETIAQNHLQGVSPQRFNLVGVLPEKSPMRLDLEEAAGMLKKDIFIVNAVMNQRHEICAFFCGHPIEAQRKGVALSRTIHGLPVREPADVLLTSSAPMDHDLRQSMKCIGNNLFCVKPQGHIVGFLRCNEGVGDVDIPPKMLPHKVFRTLLRVLGPSRIMGLVERLKKRAGVEEKFLAHFSLQVVRRNPMHFYSETLPADVGRRLGLFLQYHDAQEMIRTVAKRAPRNATALFVPYGGVTYPRPADDAEAV